MFCLRFGLDAHEGLFRLLLGFSFLGYDDLGLVGELVDCRCWLGGLGFGLNCWLGFLLRGVWL